MLLCFIWWVDCIFWKMAAHYFSECWRTFLLNSTQKSSRLSHSKNIFFNFKFLIAYFFLFRVCLQMFVQLSEWLDANFDILHSLNFCRHVVGLMVRTVAWWPRGPGFIYSLYSCFMIQLFSAPELRKINLMLQYEDLMCCRRGISGL